MKYNVEIHITQREIEQIGKDRALSHATFGAWYRALQGTNPKRSLRLFSTNTDEFEKAGPYAYRMQFSFLIDEEAEAEVRWTT